MILSLENTCTTLANVTGMVRNIKTVKKSRKLDTRSDFSYKKTREFSDYCHFQDLITKYQSATYNLSWKWYRNVFAVCLNTSAVWRRSMSFKFSQKSIPDHWILIRLHSNNSYGSLLDMQLYPAHKRALWRNFPDLLTVHLERVCQSDVILS